jgi:Secretion system C-terminal sorting domain
LHDRYTGNVTPVATTGVTTYDFSINNDSLSKISNRFHIVFKANSTLPVTFTSIKAEKIQDKKALVSWTVENELNVKEYRLEKSITGRNFSTMVIQPASNRNQYEYSDNEFNTSVGAWYRIMSIDLDGSKKYSAIANLKSSNTKKALSVFPNPVSNGQIQLQMKAHPSGIYSYRLLNKLGQLVASSTFTNVTSIGTVEISVENKMTPGVYSLEIISPDQTKETIQVVSR